MIAPRSVNSQLTYVQAEREEKEAEDKAKRAEIEAREAKRREAALGPKKGKKK